MTQESSGAKLVDLLTEKLQKALYSGTFSKSGPFIGPKIDASDVRTCLFHKPNIFLIRLSVNRFLSSFENHKSELDGVRIPRGYYNYSTHSVETLPEQNIFNLVGYDFLSPLDSVSELPLDIEGLKADIELVKNNLRTVKSFFKHWNATRKALPLQCY